MSSNTTKALSAYKVHSGFEHFKVPLPLTSAEMMKEELEARPKSKFTLKVLPGKKNSTKCIKVLVRINGTRILKPFVSG